MSTLFNSAPALMINYARYHRDERNISTHLIGVPLIFTAIALFLATPISVSLPNVTYAWCAWGLTSVWYLSRRHLALGLATTLINALWVALAHQIADSVDINSVPIWLIALGLFILGWILQLIGHLWEGKKPAFVDDLVGLLVGPMFVVGEVMMRLGLMPQMAKAIIQAAGPIRKG